MKLRAFILMLFSGVALAQTPFISHTDLLTGMCSGGESNKGHWVTIAGNNFGASQGGSVVKLGTVSLDTYKYWSNTKIAFQLGTAGGCQADGNYNITVVTGAGTSNAISFHLTSTGTIYFVDNVSGHNGSDTLNDGLYPTFSSSTPLNHGPFLTLSKCASVLHNSAGNTCYLMPGFVEHTNTYTDPDPTYGNSVAASYLALQGHHGTSTAWVGLLGYPDSNSANTPEIGSAATSSSEGVMNGNSFLVLANIHFITGTYRALETWKNTTWGFSHDLRFVNLELTQPDGQYRSWTINQASNVSVYGLNCHNISSSTVHNVGCIYLGESTFNTEIAYSTFDFSCAYTASCHDSNAGIEVHPTMQGGYPLTIPAAATLAPSTGSLGAGTYTIRATVTQTVWRIPDYSAPITFESSPSSPQTITINGTSETGIQITPPVSQYTWINNDDGTSQLCKPAEQYKIYACVGASCTPTYQNLYATYGAITPTSGGTASPVTLTTLISGSSIPSDTSNVTGCNPKNVSIHDNYFLNSTGYPVTLANMYEGYMKIYNNVFLNSGNQANAIHTYDLGPYGLNFTDFDGNGVQGPTGATTDIYNNTFYNSGAPQLYDGDIVIIPWDYANHSYPTRTYNFVNNLFYQPQVNQHWFAYQTNAPSEIVTQGSHNLCYGYDGAGSVANCPTGTTGNQVIQDPLFTSNGTLTPDPLGVGGGAYLNADVSIQSGSPAKGGGTAPPYTVTYDITGKVRPNPPSIGAYEYSGGVSSSNSAIQTGNTIRTANTVIQ